MSYKKDYIPKVLRIAVWNKYIGEHIGKTKCLCCDISDITQLKFECGHIIPESKGGATNINNLLPICNDCNKSVATKNLNDFKFAYLSNNINKNLYINKIIIDVKYICEKINEIAGHHFFYLEGMLYSFNKNNNLWYENSTETLKKFISDDLYDHLFSLLNDSIVDDTYLKVQIKELKNYCVKNKGQEEILKSFKTRFLNSNDKNIKFNMNYLLVGFNNGVYDLQNNIFRDYNFDDYITTRTKYNYRKSTKSERDTIHELINQIEIEEDKRYLLWQILASGIIGKCYQKFIIFHGRGGNGKSLISKFMIEALGEYSHKGDISTLCEKKKLQSASANPVIANMNQKRYIIFSEPEKTDKIKNSLMKELTGNMRLCARKLYENASNVVIPATVILECNEKITLQNDATDGEERRIINYTFESKFTQDEKIINNNERIFFAKDTYMTDAFIDILHLCTFKTPIFK
ncbi:D5 family helicase-primase-endonuclease [Bodo saltans virus]|uniref:D5 family helicase-primase-endonuclease n=1 Tax=Bodo saltans virus TaxID=2024608 RepID=A0A2H4UTE8_9VIRU|nr:D5 family helicase-primase-endonuclease [Bodo saltans virus]ATZ80117.1 D5 family helicase-primase-endonuclease [Bodo saltans virus]